MSNEFITDICAECGAEIDSHTDRVSLFLCNDCADPHPTEDDYVIGDVSSMSEKDRVSQYGKILFDCWPETTYARIRAHAETAQFWPNVWRVSDHGNYTQRMDVYSNAEIAPARVVYVGSIGWRDCDPMTSVSGFDQSKVETKLAELLSEESERVNDNWEPINCSACDADYCFCPNCDCGGDPDIDDLIDYGVSTFTLADWIGNCLPYGSDGESALNDLLMDGLAVY